MNTIRKFAFVTVLTSLAGLPMIAANAAETAAQKAAAPVVKESHISSTTSFEAADKDRSGSLSLKEYAESLGMKENSKQVKDRFASLDKNKDQKLEQNELVSKL